MKVRLGAFGELLNADRFLVHVVSISSASFNPLYEAVCGSLITDSYFDEIL